MHISSLDVVLCLMLFSFVCFQMGGIDEASLDRLSLVTQMTKHIRVKASEGTSSRSELGQFSPIFVWLLRVIVSAIFLMYICFRYHVLQIYMYINLGYIYLQDFYLDLVEDNRKITPRDYLEIALRPVQGGGGDIAAKNEVMVACALIFLDSRPLYEKSGCGDQV